MKRTCKQCGEEFIISNSEIAFYKQRKLSLPKRCRNCREQNKQKKSRNQKIDSTESKIREFHNESSKVQSKQAAKTQSNVKTESQHSGTTTEMQLKQAAEGKTRKTLKQKVSYAAAALLVLLAGGAGAVSLTGGDSATVPVPETEYVQEAVVQTEIQYTFRNEEMLQEHYEKHGIEMGFASADEYVTAANAVVSNPDVQHKQEKEDGDDVYYVEATNEFVVVSTDGYLRTYFHPEDGPDYFNRQ